MPNKQTITFGPKTNTAKLRQRAEKSRSNLMTFFDYNRDYTDGRHLLYYKFPTHYVYNKKDRAVNHIYYINPDIRERFFLCILLITVFGPIFYKYLRTMNGVLYGIFK